MKSLLGTLLLFGTIFYQSCQKRPTSAEPNRDKEYDIQYADATEVSNLKSWLQSQNDF